MQRRIPAAVSPLTRRTLLLGTAALVIMPLGDLGRRAAAQDATPGAQATPMPEGQTVAINGAELSYWQQGPADGMPVLLLHGGIGNTEEFHNLTPALVAAGYRVTAFDQRGRGRSTWGDLPITYDQMTTDTLAMLDELKIEKTDVVGWSDGGIVALQLAVTHPERLNRVVAYGANSRPEGTYTEPRMSDQVPPFEEFIAGYQQMSPAPERMQELLDTMDALYKVAPNFSDEDLASITVPVLILDGAEEEFVKPEDTTRMGELIPGAELLFIPGTGHFAPLARPDEFNRIVLAFLAGQPIASPTA